MSTTKCSTNCRGGALVDLGCILSSLNKLKKKIKAKKYTKYINNPICPSVWII